MNSRIIKNVVGACLVGMVVTSCQSWKYRGFQFPIVLRSPIDWGYFKNKEQTEYEPQRPQHEEERAEAAAIVRQEQPRVKPEVANADSSKVEQKTSRKDKTETNPAVKKNSKTAVKSVSKKKDRKKTSAPVKKKPVQTKVDSSNTEIIIFRVE